MSSSATGPTILRTSDPYVTNSIQVKRWQTEPWDKKIKTCQTLSNGL